MVFLACCFFNECARFLYFRRLFGLPSENMFWCAKDAKFVYVIVTQLLPIFDVEEFAIHVSVKLILAVFITAYLQFA